ncbi:unnamed protein product [Ectocarpus sp. 8 AP-2014]
MEELDAVIEDLTEDLSGSVHNPQVIKKYEKLKEETVAVRKALSELVEGNANANERTNNISAPWKEKLQGVVDRLNDLLREYMSKMDGCGGEVRLAEDESSFKKWGIDIRLRFRSEADGGKMAVLNARVHSGASGPCLPSSSSWPCRTCSTARSVWCTRSTRAWTPRTRGRCSAASCSTSADPAASRTSSSSPSCFRVWWPWTTTT